MAAVTAVPFLSAPAIRAGLMTPIVILTTTATAHATTIPIAMATIPSVIAPFRYVVARIHTIGLVVAIAHHLVPSVRTLSPTAITA